MSLSCFGAGVSIVAVVLAFSAPVHALLVSVAGAAALLLAPRATRLFGRSGLFGILSATSAIVAVVFVAAL